MSTRNERHAARRAAGWVLCGYREKWRFSSMAYSVWRRHKTTPVVLPEPGSVWDIPECEDDDTGQMTAVWRVRIASVSAYEVRGTHIKSFAPSTFDCPRPWSTPAREWAGLRATLVEP